MMSLPVIMYHAHPRLSRASAKNRLRNRPPGMMEREERSPPGDGADGGRIVPVYDENGERTVPGEEQIRNGPRPTGKRSGSEVKDAGKGKKRLERFGPRSHESRIGTSPGPMPNGEPSGQVAVVAMVLDLDLTARISIRCHGKFQIIDRPVFQIQISQIV